MVNIMKVYIERNNVQLLIRYSKNVDNLFTFTFAKKMVQCKYLTDIFTGSASIFVRWQQVLMPRISERIEHKSVR